MIENLTPIGYIDPETCARSPEPQPGMVPLYKMGDQKEMDRRYMREIARPRFITEYGREPVDEDELTAHNWEIFERVMAGGCI